MAAKCIIFLCAQAILVQNTFSQCLGNAASALVAPGLAASGLGYGVASLAAPALAAPALAASGYGYAAPAIAAVPTSGGGLPVTSVSPIAPTGLSVSSDNAIEGSLLVAGELPFLSAVALQGAFPSAGAGAVSYSCGNGVTAITSEALGLGAPALGAVAPGAALGIGSAAIAPAGLVAPGISSIAPVAGIRGCGCGGLGNGIIY